MAADDETAVFGHEPSGPGHNDGNRVDGMTGGDGAGVSSRESTRISKGRN